VTPAFRHCDPRFPFLWQSSAQPAARWHGEDEGPANYFADTPTGAWAEFLRHEGITEAADLQGVRRSLWAIELPPVNPQDIALADLPAKLLFGDESSYPACQRAALRWRASGKTWLRAPTAALLPGQAKGWTATALTTREQSAREGWVWVYYGQCNFVGWPVVEAGQPPAAVLPLTRPLSSS